MKKSMKAVLILSMVSLPLFACEKTQEKTNKLEPTTLEKQDERQGFSDLGKSAKKTFQNSDVFSIALVSDDVLGIDVEGVTHNAIENTDSTKNMNFAVNGISGDFRFARAIADDQGNSAPQMSSVDVAAQSVHWDYQSGESRSARTRNNIAFSAFVEDETLYFDPSDENLINLVKDIFDMAGFGDYKMLVSTFLGDKYFVTAEGIEEELKPYMDMMGDIENPFDGVTVDYDAVGTAINRLVVFLDEHYEDYSSWLSVYGNGQGEYVFYASFTTEEVVKFILDYADAEHREDLAANLEGLDVHGLEFALTFDADGFKALKTVFDFRYEMKTDAYDLDGGMIFTSDESMGIPEKIGHTQWQIDVDGGFTLTFGDQAPTVPEDLSSYRDLIQMIKDLESLVQ